MKRGFSASTVILVAILLGVLFWVGKVVNPPIKGEHDDHDEASNSAQQAPPPATKDNAPPPVKPKSASPPMSNGKMAGMTEPAEMNMRKMQMEKMQQMQKEKMMHAANSAPPKKDEMDASYWQQHEMGEVTPKPDATAH